MIKNSKISWTGPTYNPWQGCTKKIIILNGQPMLREECRNCYMYRDKKRYGQKPQIVVRSKPSTFNKPLKLQREVTQGKRPDFIDRLVFTCSWSDFFNPEADEWRPEAWQIIRQCPDLTFQILTKLPERIGSHLPPFWDEIKRHIWLGYSCGMPGAEGLIEYLIQHDSAVRFLSCEPLIGWIQIERYLSTWKPIVNFDIPPPKPLHPNEVEVPSIRKHSVDWVIIGGESGPQARLMKPEWAKYLMNQCRCRPTAVPVFIKQMGTAWARVAGAKDRNGEDMAEWPERFRVREFPRI